RISTLNNLRHGVLLKLIRKPYALVHIRLSLVPKLPSKASTNLGAPHWSELVQPVKRAAKSNVELIEVYLLQAGTI
ncbi:MAG: hypothetical protein ABJ360_11955, partial [Roseobacter sp.]